MTRSRMTGETCVGDLRLSALDVGFDLRLHPEIAVDVPMDCTSVGLDDGGETWLIVGPRDELLRAIRRAGYRVA